MKNLIVVFLLTYLVACGSDNSDGSDPTTYSSCSITDSSALFAGDREKDVSQCWDGVNYKEKSLALNWCAEKINDYIGQTYVFGHSVEYQVASTNCP